MFIKNRAGKLCGSRGFEQMHSFPAPFYNKQLIYLMICEVFLDLDDTIGNNDDNVKEVEKTLKFAGICSGFG